MTFRIAAFASLVALAVGCSAEEPPSDPVAAAKASLAEAEKRLASDPSDMQALLGRGDSFFFLGRFDDAVRDYDRMIELSPDLEPTHWQRGLALHFAGRYDDAAKQFERFYELDQSDRENGIWRFYAQVEKLGVYEARKRLLRYVDPDREPLPLVYRMCGGETTPGEVLKSVESAQVPAGEKAKRQFYADLYVGLDAAIVRDDPAAARPLLARALKSSWPRGNGYGPNFMWHVARLSLDRIGKPEIKP